MTSLPTWAVALVAFGTPASALFGVLISQYLTRKSATEQDRRGRREETMRNLRWASELAVSTDDESKADLGVAQLAALLRSDLLERAEQGFVEATLGVVFEDPVAVLERLGPGFEVVYDVDQDLDHISGSIEPGYDEDTNPPERS